MRELRWNSYIISALGAAGTGSNLSLILTEVEAVTNVLFLLKFVTSIAHFAASDVFIANIFL